MRTDVAHEPLLATLGRQLEAGKPQVWPVKPTDLHDRAAQAKQLHDVGANAGRGRSGQRHDGRTRWQRVDKARNLLVGRPKVLPPLAHAMRLVYGNERNVGLGGKGAKRWVAQTLRRNIHDVVPAGKGTPQHLRAHAWLERGIVKRSTEPGFLEGTHLISHERDER